jgi:cyclopropane fatty-acyl-phospholipid synthase-like methyltransferase
MTSFRNAFIDAAYETGAPWEIGRPQPAFVRLFANVAIAGRVLDVGCGSGDLVIHLCSRGVDASGIDASAIAIARAQMKAEASGMDKSIFRVADALQVHTMGNVYDVATDSGFLHTLTAEERRFYATSLTSAVRAGGSYYALCISDRENPEWGGPHRIAPDDFANAFRDRWSVAWVREAKYQTTLGRHLAWGGADAWLTRIDRLEA